MLDQPVETIVVDSVENLKDFGISSDRLIKQSGTLHRRDLSNYICNSGRLEPGNIAVFSQKGDLLCNNIVHCTFPAYDGTVKSNLRCWKSMRKVIRKLLSYVVDNDISSIAIPILGIESKDYESTVFGKVFFGELKNFIRKNRGDMDNKRIIIFSEESNISKYLKQIGQKILVERGNQSEPDDEEDKYLSEKEIRDNCIEEHQQALQSEKEKELQEVLLANSKLEQKLSEKRESLKIAKERVNGLEEELQESIHKYKNAKKSIKERSEVEESKSSSEEKECKKCHNMFDLSEHLKKTKHLKKYCTKCYPNRIRKEVRRELEADEEEEEEEPEKVTKKTKRTKKSRES